LPLLTPFSGDLLRSWLSIRDHFTDFEAGNFWTTVFTPASNSIIAVGIPGSTLPNGQLGFRLIDSVANREAYIHSASLFQVQADKTLLAEAYLQFTEANTNQAAIVFGFMDSVAVGALQNSTGLPRAGFSGAIIFKAPGSNVWQTASGAGGAATITTSDQASGGSAFQRLRIQIRGRTVKGFALGGATTTDVLGEVTYYVNDTQLRTLGQRPGFSFIKDYVTYTGAPLLQAMAGIKQNSNFPESLDLDYLAVGASQ
jgi:hypothetical protein